MLGRLRTLLARRRPRVAPRDPQGSVASFRETFRQRPRSGSAEFLFSEIRNAFDPSSRFIQAWHQLVLFCIVYELFILPYIVVFTGTGSGSAPHRILSTTTAPADGSGVGLTPLASMAATTQRELVALYVCEIVFCLDIYVQLNTGYYEDGNVLRDTRKSRLKYLRSWAFVLDASALPPLALMLPARVVTGQYRAYLEFHKLLRVRRLPKLIANLDDFYARHFELLKLGKVLVTTLFVSHIVACARFSFSYDRNHTNHWLPKVPAEEHTPRRRYLMSLFWAFGLLTGLFEGELPHTAYEFCFTIVIGLCGFSLFTYLCATFFFLSKCEGGENETAEARVNQFQHLLSFHRVSDELQAQAVGYLKRYYAQAEANDREASKLLCPSIAVDIQIELLQVTIAAIPVFEGCDPQFIKAVTSLLDIVSYPSQLVLFREGDRGDAMYVIESGVVNTLVNNHKVRELRKGAFFGEVAIFANLPRSATMVTATYSTLYRLSRTHTDKLMEGYPRLARRIRKKVDEMRNATSQVPPPTVTEDIKSSNESPTVTAVRRRNTKQVFMEAVGLKRRQSERQSCSTHDAKNAAATIDEKNPNEAITKEPRSEIIIPPPSPLDVHATAPAAFSSQRQHGATGVESDATAVPRRQRLSLPTLSRYLSWREPRSHQVIPAALAPGSRLIHRRSSLTESLLTGQQKQTSIANKSRSQLELLKSSLLRLGRGSIDAVRPDVMKGFYDQIQRMKEPRSGTKRWWKSLLLRRCIPVESRLRMMWVVMLQLDLCYNWVIVPLQLSFPLFDRPRWYIQLANAVVDVILWVDIYVNLNLSFAINSEMIFDTARSAERYVRSGHLLADVMCSLPYEWIVRSSLAILPLESTSWSVEHSVLRLPRLLRVWRVVGHFSEVEEYFVFKSKQRLLFFVFLLMMLYHVVACLHFSITYWEGFSPNYEAWIPSDDIFLDQVNSSTFVDQHGNHYAIDSDQVSAIQAKQYFRSLYYATNVLAALGKTIEPSSDRQYGLALLFMLSGFLITAIVVDNVQKRFTASALEQKEFFATRARIQLFLKRQEAPFSIHQRVNSFLDYWWSSHRGAIIGELLDELPVTIKRDIVRSICKPAVESIGMLFPQIWTEEKGRAHNETLISARHQIEELFLDNLKFVLYGQNEVVYSRGDYPSGIYFLLEGQVCAESGSTPPRRIPIGGCFGTAALEDRNSGSAKLPDGLPGGFKEKVTALSGSIVVYLPREYLSVMQAIYPDFANALRASEKRLQIASRAKKAGEIEAGITRTIRPGAFVRSIARPNASIAQWIKSTVLWKIIAGKECIDPDSSFIGFWEVWVFVAMTAQTTMVIYHTCFGVDTGAVDNTRRFVASDAIIMFLESCFLVDIFIRTRLGFYQYGNKVMSLRQIKAHYIGSKYFMIDILAIIPFFVINWVGFYGLTKRLEIVNANKLLRLFKSSSQFRALDAKHVRRTFELRIVRLVYYTFLASHTFGCIWFDFAAHNSGPFPSNTTSFGWNRWLPYEELERGSRNLQYFSSVYWSFGLMTAASTGELPKTVPQCLFSVVTMTTGFFLFAYVVGNFLDVFELKDSDNRQFIAKLSSLRHLLGHFKLPSGIEGKFKTYFFFKRFHSITQEHLLERVLPPSLLVDIRMFQLQPMIVKVAFLAGMEDSVTRMLVSLFTQILVVKDMYICKFGEEGKEMFFIFTGVLDIYIPLPPGVAPIGHTASTTEAATAAIPADDMIGLLKVNQITAGSYFGEAALFTKAPRNAYVKARTSCILYRLSRESLELVFDRFPEWKEKVLRIVAIQQEQQRLMRLAAQAQEEEGGGAGGRRSLRRTRSRIDLINLRAEDMEELVLIATRGGRGSHLSVREWVGRRFTCLPLVAAWLKRAVVEMRRWLLLLLKGAEVQSPFYLFWLRLVTFSTVYLALIVPYRCAYDDLERWTPLPVLARTLESLCEVVLWLDVWFHFRIHDSLAAMELYEQDHLQSYKRERLLWDILGALPFDQFITDQYTGSERSFMRRLLRLNRCLKVANLPHYRLEVNRRSVTYEKNRLVTLTMLYLLMMYWTSCAYIAVALHTGFGDNWQSWLPSKALYATDDTNMLVLRLLRGCVFAMTAFVKKGKTFTPTQTLTHAFTVTVSFVGQLIMAFMIGEIATLFMLFIDNEVEFRKNHISVEQFMSRKRLSPQLRHRCNAFLMSWWSSHAGVNYQAIFDDLPPTVRTEGVAFIARTPLNKFMDRVFRPLTSASGFNLLSSSDDDDIIAMNADVTVENLMHVIAQHLRFEGYPRGEAVVVEGRVCRAVFFVVRGNLYSKSVSNPLLYHAMRFRAGDYFGEKGLLGHAVSLFTVSTIRACDLFVLRAEHLMEAIKSLSYFAVLFRMAQDIVRQKKTPEEYFKEGFNQNRRDVLHRRLSAPLVSNAPTPTFSRPRSKTKRSIADTPILRGMLHQSSQLEWEEAFRQFMQMLVPQGTLTVSEGEATKEVETPKDLTKAHAGLPQVRQGQEV